MLRYIIFNCFLVPTGRERIEKGRSLVYLLQMEQEVLAGGLDYYHFYLDSNVPSADVRNLLRWKIERAVMCLIVSWDKVNYDQYLKQHLMKDSLGFDRIQHQKERLLKVDQSFGSPQTDSNFLFEPLMKLLE